MGADSAFQYLSLTLDVFVIDLLLSGDNAVVIALACRGLPARQKRQGMLLGTLAAIGLRIVLTIAADVVLGVPLLRLLGGLALVVIAIQLVADDETADSAGKRLPGGVQQPLARLPSAVRTIVVADLVMSLDNVLALAAVARGNIGVLALGLLLSVPLLMAGGWYVGSLLVRYPFLVRVGGAMLGWFAGDIAASDALYAGWVDQQSPALHVVVPALCAMYVVLQAGIVDRRRSAAAALRPEPAVAPSLPALSALVRDPSMSAARKAPLPTPRGRAGAAAGDAVADAISAKAPAHRRAWPRRPVLVVVALLVATCLGYWIVAVRWMPVRASLARYECSNNTTLYYTPGGRRIAVAAGENVVHGVILSNNQIDWGNYHDASVKLKTVPPTRVLFGTTSTVRVEGGFFNGVTCIAR